VEINIALLQMVYGVGVQTKRGRCFEFWQELMQCTREAELPKIDCKPQVEDYLECLHRSKEVRNPSSNFMQKQRMIEIIRRLREKSKNGTIKEGE